MSTEHPSVNGGNAVHQKSFKRKYRKLRHKFKDVMKHSDELFKQEQLANAAIRRMQEENTRIMDLLVDLNDSPHLSKERRHNIGSPGRTTPTRFLSPTLLATIAGGDPSILDPNGDIEAMELEYDASNTGQELKNDSNSTDDEDEDEDDDEKTPAPGQGSKYNSDDEDDDKEAYLEEIREWNYKRGIAGTPPRSIREKIKAEAEQERKVAEEQAKKAAVEAAIEKRNGITAATVVPNLKQEANEDDTANGLGGPTPAPLILEDYRRGHTPEYLKNPSPFLMTLEEEDEWYTEIHDKHDGHVPRLVYPPSPSAAKAECDPRNPMSVYCWLRKNQPQVFLQGEEGEKKAGGRGRGGGRKKAVEAESGDEAGMSAIAKKIKPDPDSGKLAGAKRRRTNGEEIGDTLAVRGSGNRSGRGGGSGTGGRGGRKKAEGEPPLKRQRR
ncbi:IEC3 subunit of the Ino80 complex, chromatin re-modelling-domain-containing protein [Geopyxis carbonaria]|nr:IEC3 subunit of the Ino80 complex, chromatin re-modelling-domain-containing protein [Geopyxis carbonaria]